MLNVWRYVCIYIIFDIAYGVVSQRFDLGLQVILCQQSAAPKWVSDCHSAGQYAQVGL
jgi:hypothetical protein